MPMYEYECRTCKARFEQLILGRAAEVVCRTCGSPDVAQLLSTFAVGAESAKKTSPASPCDGCNGMKGGSCPMNQ